MDFSSTINLIAAIIFYALAGLVTILSAFTLYLLNKHGERQSAAMAVSVLYIILFLVLLTRAYTTLHSLYNA